MTIIQAGIEIRAEADGVEQIRQLSDALDAAGVDAADLRQEGDGLLETWRRLENEQGLINRYRAIGAALTETANETDAARRAAETLQRQMENGGTRQQRRELERLNTTLADLRARQANLTEQMRQTGGQMRDAGLDIRNLAAEEARLAEEARRAQEESADLAAQYQRLRDLADARIELGLADDNGVEEQIRRVTEAYERLRDSGTLSQEELARAAEAHRERLREIEWAAREGRVSLADMAQEIGGVVGSAAGLTLLAKEAMAFESAMAGVKKVADGTDGEIAALGGRMKELAVQMGMMPAEMAAIAEQGGQLGIALDKLPAFTEMAAKMAVAFKVSAEEAGEAAATISNVYQMPIERVEALADAVNVLGNNTAAKEADIINVMTRIGGTARQFGLAAEEAAALGDAFIALGKPPEVAATAINAMLGKLQAAQAQGAAFKDALATLGLTADQLAAGLNAAPQQALTDFLRQLQALDGQTRAMVLTDLFGTEFADDVAVLVGSLDDYERALRLATDRAGTAGAVNKELGNAMSTTEHAVNQAKAALSATAATVGQALLPALTMTAKAAGGVMGAVGGIAAQFPALTRLAVLYASVRVALKAYDTAVTLAGGNAQTSFLRSSRSIASYRASILSTAAAMRTLAVQTRAALTGNGAQLNAVTGAFAALGKGILGATRHLLAFAAAWTAGWEVGKQLREASTFARDLGDNLAKPLAMLDSLWDTGGLDKYREHYKTQRQSEREREQAEREAEKVRRRIAEQRAREAELAAEHLNILRRTAKARQDELAAAERSAKAAEAAGLAEGELHRQMLQRTAELRRELDVIRQQMREAGESYTFDVGPLAEAKTALKELGLSVAELNSGIGEKSAKAVEDFGKAAGAFGNDAETMARIFAKALAQMEGEQATAALKAKLAEVGKQAGLTAEQIADIAQTAPDAADKVGAAFAKLGVDVKAVKTGIGQDAQEAFAAWQSASAAAREAGGRDARLIRAAFEQMMGKLASRQEFDAFRRQLQQSGDAAGLTSGQLARLNEAAQNGAAAAGSEYGRLADRIKQAADQAGLDKARAAIQEAYGQGVLSAAEYEQALIQVKERTAELDEASEKAGQQAAAAHEKAAQAAQKQAQAGQQAAAGQKTFAQAAEEGAQRAGGAWTRMTVNVHDYLSMTREQIDAMNASMKMLPALGRGLAGLGNLPEWAARVKTFKDGVNRAEEAIRELNQAVQDGTVSQQMIARATAAGVLAFGRLDQTTLNNLHAAIDDAKRKLAELQQEAADTAESLEAELAGLRGDEGRAAELEQQRKLRELNAKLAQAEAQGNDEAAASYRRALSLQQEIYREQGRKRTEQAKQTPQQDIDLTAITSPDVRIDAAALGDALAKRDQKVAEQAAEAVMSALEQAVARQV